MCAVAPLMMMMTMRVSFSTLQNRHSDSSLPDTFHLQGRRYVPPKRRQPPTRLYSVINQKKQAHFSKGEFIIRVAYLTTLSVAQTIKPIASDDRMINK
jgi:hypothetical protein